MDWIDILFVSAIGILIVVLLLLFAIGRWVDYLKKFCPKTERVE
jgi:hypothetical protein